MRQSLRKATTSMLLAIPLLSLSQRSTVPPRTSLYPDISGTTSRNYVLEFTSTSGDEYQGVTKVTYLDGMGRPVESITSGVSRDGFDIVEAIEYDDHGRQNRQWISTPLRNSTKSGYVPTSVAKSAISAYHSDAFPFSSIEYEAFRAGKPISEQRPGQQSYFAHAKQTCSYASNDASSPNLSCRRYSAFSVGECDVRITDNGTCPSGTYRVIHTIDYDGTETLDFSDRNDRLYLQRKISGKETADTYYLRDGSGSLIAVLPPLLSNSGLSSDAINNHAYLYSYDSQHRLAAYKRPGCSWRRFRYDKSDRAIMEQDGKLLSEGISIFHLYDRHGRECITGTCRNKMNDASWQSSSVYCEYIGEKGTFLGYNVSGITLESPKIIKTNYYDNYNFINLIDEDMSFRQREAGDTYKTSPATLLTGSISAILGGPDTLFLKSVSYYEDRNKPIQTISTSIVGGIDVVNMTYTEGGLLSLRTLYHEMTREKTATERYSYTYDNAGRETLSSYSIDFCGKAVSFPLRHKEYDDLGRLLKETQTTSKGENMAMTYKYDINNAIKETVHPLFSQLFYREASATTMRSKPQYGGRISATTWRAADSPSLERGYSYYYDQMGNLDEAIYYEDGDRREKYDTSYGYDIGGNTISIQRNGLVGNDEYNTLDNLILEYDGGRLGKVSDSGKDSNMNGILQFRARDLETAPYSYDENGNMTKDMYKDISQISYNILNLPEKVIFTTGEEICFWYDADGNKVHSIYNVDSKPVMPPYNIDWGSGSVPRDVSANSSATVSKAQSGIRLSTNKSYCANITYESGQPSRIHFDGGYISVSFDGKTLADHHYVYDGQGNIRVVASAAAKAEQVNHYYPFGGLFGESTSLNGQRRRYGGKELERMRGLDWYYYGARWYDPILCRWTTRDALEEKYPWLSAYCFCANDPVNNIDPDGNDWYIDIDGSYQFSPYIHSQKDLTSKQKYMKRSFTMGSPGSRAYYRSDGSILYENETAAYKRMWKQADVHYRRSDDLGREVGAFLLTNGKVLVLPDYDNEYDTSKIGAYGYKLNGTSTVTKGKEKFQVLAQIHTHQKGTGKFAVSPEDAAVSESLGTRPVFVIHWGGNVYIVLQNSLHSSCINLARKKKNLLNGQFKLYNYVRNRIWKF